MFSISSSEIPKVPTGGELATEKKEKDSQERGGGGDKEEREQSGDDREALDEEDGKFGEQGPIFNSGLQATDDQQGGGWMEGRRGDHAGRPSHVGIA